jgi:hypothetical protein
MAVVALTPTASEEQPRIEAAMVFDSGVLTVVVPLELGWAFPRALAAAIVDFDCVAPQASSSRTSTRR